MKLKPLNLNCFLLSSLVGIFYLMRLTEQAVTELSLGFQTRSVQILNTVRKKYQVPDLLIFTNLTINAQKTAESLAKNDNGLTNASGDLLECGKSLYTLLSLVYTETATPQCGQNIAEIEVGSNLNCQPEIIIRTWEAEKIFYNYENPPSDFISRAFVSQFTQLVWKESQYVGVGVAISDSGRHCYVVARYWPAGNIVGKYWKNVLQEQASGANRAFASICIYLLLHSVFYVVY